MNTTTPLERPEFLPEDAPAFIAVDKDVFEYRKIPGIGHNNNQNDGVLYYYDQPILFVAWVRGRQCLVTLLNEGYANEGMKDGYAFRARGWEQWIAIPIDDVLLKDIVENKIELRTAYTQMPSYNYFIHKDWTTLDLEDPDIPRHDPRRWFSVYRIWPGVPVKDKWKPVAGVKLVR